VWLHEEGNAQDAQLVEKFVMILGKTLLVAGSSPFSFLVLFY
jgi:hypothetical protein